MSDHHLSLPFCYELSVIPGSRFRVVRDVTVREYVDVIVPELRGEDAPVVIRGMDYDEPFELRSWERRLYRAARNFRTKERLDPESFEDAVSPIHDRIERHTNEPTHRGSFGTFPTPGGRWGLERLSPLLAPRLDTHIEQGGWRDDRTELRSTRAERRAEALRFLPQAVVSIDGIVHLASPEPVWRVMRDSGTNQSARVRLTSAVMGFPAHDDFRLDRLEEALAYARLLADRVEAPAPLEYLAPDACLRDDEWCMAQWLVSRCRYLQPVCRDPEDPRDAAARVVMAARERQTMVSRDQVEDILDAVEISLLPREDEDERLLRHPRTDAALYAIRERWRLAKEAGRYGERHLLDQEDIDALEGIADEY